MGKRGLVNLLYTACMPKLMICSNKQRTLKRRQRRLWLTLPDLPMSFEQNKTTLAANEMAVKGGRNAMAKLEGRIREMEMELGGVQSKTSETYKYYQKSERRIKELNFQRDEDKKNSDRITELAQKLQQKIKVYKKQIEEAEEIAALNLAKYRKAQQELEETEDRSRMAEGALSVARQSTGFM